MFYAFLTLLILSLIVIVVTSVAIKRTDDLERKKRFLLWLYAAVVCGAIGFCRVFT